jgi:hypothetical protein
MVGVAKQFIDFLDLPWWAWLNNLLIFLTWHDGRG